jgi:hypothetical protein
MEKCSLFQPWRVSLKINNIVFTENEGYLLIEHKKEEKEDEWGNLVRKEENHCLELKIFINEQGDVAASFTGISIKTGETYPAHAIRYFLVDKKEFADLFN